MRQTCTCPSLRVLSLTNFLCVCTFLTYPHKTTIIVLGYQRLFTLRKERYRTTESLVEKRNNNAGKYSSWEPWASDPKTWDELAQELSQDDEPILSIDMFQCRERIQPFQV